MMTSGRTKPALFGCNAKTGAWAGDFVVKLVGSMDARERGPSSEFISSRLARHFGILHPEPAAVTVAAELAAWLSAKNHEIASSIVSTPNFGSRLLTDASLWPVGRSLPEAMIPAAAQIFAFDALIGNDDRRSDNQNILVRGDEIFVIDHEAAFAFLYLVASRERSWECRSRRSLRNHVFFFQLRRQELNLRLFTQRLSELSDTVLETIVAELPVQWRHRDLGRISDHFRAARENAAEFERHVLEALA
jgi:hypothetical protein